MNDKNKRIMKNKIICFILFFAYIVGAIGGFGYAIYSHAYVIAAAVVVLAVMAFPTFKNCIKELLA